MTLFAAAVLLDEVAHKAPLLAEVARKAPKGGESVKSGPIGLAVILVLCVAAYFLFKSMSRHLRKVREGFPVGQPRPPDAAAARGEGVPSTVPPERADDRPDAGTDPGRPRPPGPPGATP